MISNLLIKVNSLNYVDLHLCKYNRGGIKCKIRNLDNKIKSAAMY